MRYLILLTACICSYGGAAIYDCFMFNNEVEILEIRLHELCEHVDKFVLVESVESHRTGDLKPCYFELNKERFEPFLDKIIHIKLEERLETDDGWERENWQRDQIMRGLVGCEPNDLILISDVDEIIPADVLKQTYKLSASKLLIGFWQKMYRFFLNRNTEQLWAGTGALRYKHLLRLTPQGVRNRVRNAQMFSYHAGWHFTSMGGYQRAVEKYYDIVEGCDDFLSFDEWRSHVDALSLVLIDDTYPQYVQENLEYLTHQGLLDA